MDSIAAEITKNSQNFTNPRSEQAMQNNGSGWTSHESNSQMKSNIPSE